MFNISFPPSKNCYPEFQTCIQVAEFAIPANITTICDNLAKYYFDVLGRKILLTKS